MLPLTLSILLTATFAFLGGLHVYWAFGGRLWFDGTFPQIEGKPLTHPGILATMVVAIGLFCMGALSTLLFLQDLQVWTWLGWGVAAIFLLRAIGEFKYVGLFKRKRESLFARRDTRIYTPLCLGIAASLICLLLL